MANSQTLTLNIKALFDASDVKAKVGDIQSSLSKLKLPDKLATDLNKSFTGVNKALDDFISRTEKGIKTKSDASGITKSFENVSKELTNLDNLMIKVKSQLGDGVDLSKIIKFDGSVKEKLENINKEITVLQQKINSINTAKLKQLETALAQITSKGAREQGAKALELFNTGDLVGASQVLDSIIAKLKAVKTANETQGHNTANIENNIKLLETMQNAIQDAQRQTTSLITEQNAKIAEGAQVAKNASEEYVNGLNKQIQGLHQVSSETSGLTSKINDLASSQAQFVREVDQVKSRIQYFFGLSNAINLVKRAVRGAVETIKDLDKAMTETAVVTDFTVSDMWKQLPEYTKRANELGVTTQAAYEAATLYYQQGLNNEEVNALSVETLKMARIAGLDAAEATDRMTNALRGFNMELDTANAQRVDDVYSELAANTASNVDEISTAMTKVASLAHSANMEFETTAAFLAQIIETTRESAETAGTALKTVVARFSEVKKLVDENQLRGQDEEGQVVDVNKVSAALHTAGIDLNKYFLGEVGLDDIFMELASKWDSLNSIQQRYIATQAAGSRQQSRFIALMQDYARMQELVGKAYNAEGASAKQFEKTQESLESKLARLKNAWNEFLMGLTNNVMVKKFVDILTDLLNLVNKITSAFGDGVGSILKWTVALGTLSGLRRLFTDGGLATQLIGGLMGHGLGANRLRSSMGLGVMDATTQQYTAYSAQQLKANRGTTIIGGLGSGLKSFGTKAWNTAGALGSIYGLEGMAAGLTGVATALGAVAVAVAVVYAGYQAWLNLTPEGQVKVAENYAKSLNNVASATQETAKSAKTAKARLTELNKAEMAATSIDERNAIIQDRNEYIKSLLEENSAYAEYLNTEIIDGQLVLTLNDAGISQMAADAAKAAVVAAVNAGFAQSAVSDRQAGVLRSKLNGVDLENKTITTTVGNNYQHDVTRALTQAEIAQYTQYQLELDSLIKQSRAQAQSAFAQMIDTTQVSDNVANLMSEALATGFDGVDLPSGSGWWRSRGHWQNEYRNLYGTEADSSLKTSDIYRAVRLAENTQGQQDQTKELTRLVTGNQGSVITKLLESYLGKGDFQAKSLASLNTNDDAAIYRWLGVVDESEEGLEQFKQNIVDLAKALGIETNELVNNIKKQAKEQKKQQAQNVLNTSSTMAKSGVSTQNIEAFIRLDDLEAQNMFQTLYNSFDPNFLTDGVVSSLLAGIAEGDEKLSSWFNNLDLNNPISAFHELTTAANSGQGAVKDVAEELLKVGETTQQFSASNQLAFLTLSEEYEDISKELNEYIDKEGHISSDNIKEAAKSSKNLKNLLDDGTFSAKALATALEGIETGKIEVWDLNDAIIAALNSMSDLEEIVESTIDDLNDFDPGYDENDITGFISKAYKTISENVKKGAIGNNQIRTYLQKIFGEDIFNFDASSIDEYGRKYEAKVAELTGILEANQENMYQAWQGALGTYTTASGETLEIFNKGNEVFIEGAQVTTDELVKIVAEATGLGEQWARMMVADYKNYSPDFKYQQSLADMAANIRAWYDALPEIDGQKIYDSADIGTIAKLFDLGADQVQAAVDKLQTTSGNLKAITWTNEDGERTAQSIQAALDDIGVTVRNTSEQYSADLFDYDNFKNAYNKLGMASWFESDFNTILGEGDKFTATFFGETQEVSIKAGQTAGEAYAEAYQKAVNSDLATQIGDAFKEVFTGLDFDFDTSTGLAKIAELKTKTEEAQGKLDTLGTTTVNPEVNVIDNASTTLDSIISDLQTLANTHVNPTVTVTVSERLANIGASGGVVQSQASGSIANTLKPGPALTGEEGPEIVWNKDKGYAYITGEQHPEFQNLQPGDRVFNAQETKKILNGAANGGKVPSLARGYGKANTKPSGGSGGSRDRDSDDDYKKESTWRNELDWLYDLMEDIAEYERQQTIIQTRNEMVLKDVASSGRDLYNLTLKELTNLETQLDGQQAAQIKRLQQMGELQTLVNAAGYGQYMQWNDKDKTLEIDWDAIEAIQDKETYDEVVDWLNRMEGVQDQIDDAEDAMWDIRKQIQDLQQRYLQQYLEFQNRVLQAVVKQYQDQIDKLSELNGTLNDTNTSILDSIQREIDLERQIRDNTDTESNIADMEARLAYLQRDTTGANDSEIRSLQKSLDEARESYSDNLVDQAIDRLAQSNEDAAAQREKQIEIMQAQLDYWQESGALWGEVDKLISEGFNGDGSLTRGSELEKVLQNADNYKAMSQAQRDNWANELILETNQVGAHILEMAKGLDVNAYQIRALLSGLRGQLGGTPEHSFTAVKTEEKYATGGLNTYTGLAHLDGTPSAPEYVLNPEQTNAFLRLADVLPSVMSGSPAGGASYGGNIYLNLDMHVDEIANDYDVDKIADRVKDILYNASSYRNVNTLNFIR